MPILDAHSMEFISRSPEQTRRAGMRLGALLEMGDVVCLVGDLGAGKTTLIQGISAGWGSLDQVSSPTFVLVNVYRRPEGNAQDRNRERGEKEAKMGGRLFHLDAYRLSSSQEAEDLDLVGMMEKGPMVVEWADRIRSVLPDEHLWISMMWIDENQRDLILSAHGARYQSLLADFRRQVFGVS